MRLIELGPHSGKLADVIADPHGWVVVYQDEADGHLRFVQLNPDGSRRVPDTPIAAFGGNAFPVLCWDKGLTWLAFRDGVSLVGVLMNITAGVTSHMGVVHGNCPIAFGFGWMDYQTTAVYDITVRSLRSGQIVSGFHGKPTGIASVQDSGVPVLVDDVRLAVPGMVNPRYASGCFVGENADAGQNRAVAQLEGTGRGCDLWAGQDSFTPHIAYDGHQWAVVTWGTSVRLALLEDADFVVPQPPDPQPEPLPDIPWTTNPTGVVEDVWPWIANNATALSPDGRVAWILKSDEANIEGQTCGEHWDHDALYVGHLEDSSTGYRWYAAQHKRVNAIDWVNMGEPEPWANLPLERNYFNDGARLWLPRRCVTGYRQPFVTDIHWIPSGYVQPNIPMETRVDVGYARFGGRVAFVRGVYSSSGDGGHTFNDETNYYGPTGWVTHTPARKQR